MTDNPSMPCRDTKELFPECEAACRILLEELNKQGVSMFVTQTYRSAQYQNQLYQQGRTTRGNIVTGCDGYKAKSQHQSRLAFDLACRGKILYDNNMLAKAGKVAQSLGIEWGGGWSGFKDSPHFQIKKRQVIKPLKEEYKMEQVKLNINGTKKVASAIVVDGVTYVELRDLQSSKISIGYNTETKERIVTTK